MKTFLFVLGLFTTFSAHALVFEVRGWNDEALFRQYYPMADGVNAGRATVDFLELARSRDGISWEGNERGVLSIAGLGNQVVQEGNEIRAYGWCYSVNGVEPDRTPDQVIIPHDMSRLVWFYAYGRMVDGEWREQCVPATR